MRKFERLSTAALILIGRLLSGAEPGDVEIQHEAIRCWPTDQFLFADSTFVPSTELQTAKLYLRSSLYPDYYFVEMTLGRDGTGRAILPMAEAQTREVVYYLELVTKSYSAFRTEEMSVPVSSGSECQRQDPETAFYNGPNPDIALGATRAGVPQLAPGFRIDGISRFIDIIATPGAGGGGGVSGKTVGLLAGAGGGAAAALVLLGGSSDATSSVVGGVTTVTTTAGTTTTVTGGGPSSTTTTATGGGGGPSSTTTTVSGGPSSTTTTVVGGPTTTTSVGPSTTTTTGGPSTTTTTGGPSTTTTTGGPTTTTSVGSSTTTSAGSSTTTSAGSTTTTAATTSSTTSVASTTTTSTGTINLQMTKSADTNPVRVSTVFNYYLDITNVGSLGAANAVVTDTLPAGVQYLGGDPRCVSGGGQTVNCFGINLPVGQSTSLRLACRSPASPGTITNSAIVNWAGGSDSANVTISVTTALRGSSDAARISLRSFLDIEPYDGDVRGRFVLNDSDSAEVRNDGPGLYPVKALPGENRLSASLVGGARGQGLWRFDFSGVGQFVPGSIRTDSGQVYAEDATSVVFVVSAQTLLSFRFQLSEVTP